MASIVWSIDIFSRYPVPNGYGDREAIAMGSAGRTRKKLRTSLSAVRHLSTDATEMVERYRAGWPEGLLSKSRRPHLSPARKVSEQERAWIAELRQRGLGSRRIQSELKRAYDLELSRPTIEKVFQSVQPQRRLARKPTRKHSKRYAKEIPGERVQMDTCKIAPGLYQYTAIDDCTRIRVLALYKRRGAANSLLFLEKVIEAFPFRSKEYKPIAVVNSLPTLSRRSSWNIASSSVP